MTVTVKLGDYLIVDVVAGKRVLARCSSVSPDGKRCRAVIESDKDSEEKEPPLEFKTKEVIANLGSSPFVGKVYSINVEPVRERVEHPYWGQIKIYHPLSDEHRKILRSAMKEVQRKLESKKMPAPQINTEIRTQQGKMAGFYKYRPKADHDVLCVKLDPDMSDLEYRFAHEFAHGLWFRHFLPKMKMAWVNMYHRAVAVTAYKDKDLKQLLDDIVAAGDLRTFFKDNPDDVPVLRVIFRHIKQTHSVERQHFEMALMLGEDVSQYWPTAVELGEKKTILTTYAEKSPEELWAESFALWFIGKKLPKNVLELLTKSLSRLAK